MPNMLIVDDNRQISSILAEYAKREGFDTMQAYDGKEALEKFFGDTFAVVLLDVMMPEIDGFEVCRKIRAASNVPIIMVTARGEDFEKIMGLDIGADDYIVKPFSPSVVMARVRALLRRISGPGGGQVFTLHNLTVNLDEYKVTVGGEAVSLTKKEIELLWIFANNPNKVFSRDNLLDSIWGYDYYGDSRTVDSHIKRLRSKLDAYPHKNWDIKTIWGVGYKLEV